MGRHLLKLAVGMVLAFAAASASHAVERPHLVARAGPIVPRGDFLVSDQFGRLRILDQQGKLVRRLPRRIARYGPDAIALTRDRRFAFVRLATEAGSRLYLVNLATGTKRRFASAISPAMSPGRTHIAYLSVVRRRDIHYKDALVVRSLRTRRVRTIPLSAREAIGTPPENVINWSPDGRRIAIYDNGSIRIVTVGARRLELSPPVAPRSLMAPVFIDRNRLVALANCCIGRQRLVTINLRSGSRHPFAVLPAPPETIRRLRDGVLLVTTASGALMIVSHRHTTVIARGVTAADR
jgi:hypothetical protein